jgi:hypothetical protein
VSWPPPGDRLTSSTWTYSLFSRPEVRLEKYLQAKPPHLPSPESDAPFSIQYVRRNSSYATYLSPTPSFLALRCALHSPPPPSGVCYFRRCCSRAEGHLKLRPWKAENKEGEGISFLNSRQRTFFVFSVSKASPGSVISSSSRSLGLAASSSRAGILSQPSHSGPDPYSPGSADPDPDVLNS